MEIKNTPKLQNLGRIFITFSETVQNLLGDGRIKYRVHISKFEYVIESHFGHFKNKYKFETPHFY